MRTNFILAIMAGILLCAVCTLEIPELLKLTDDTSNDFPLVEVQEIAPHAVEATERLSGFTPVVASSPKPRSEASVRFQSRGFEPSVDDFLHSLCVIRT